MAQLCENCFTLISVTFQAFFTKPSMSHIFIMQKKGIGGSFMQKEKLFVKFFSGLWVVKQINFVGK